MTTSLGQFALTSSQTIDTNFSTSVGYNALTIGPITISAGVTVTVVDGTIWTIT